MISNFKKLTILLTTLNFMDSSNLFSGGTRKHSRHHSKAKEDPVKKSKHSRHHSKTKEDSPKKLKHSGHSKAKEEWEALYAPISPEEANKCGENCEEGVDLCLEAGDLMTAIEYYCAAIRYYTTSKNTGRIILCYEKIIELLKSSKENNDPNLQIKYNELENACNEEIKKLKT